MDKVSPGLPQRVDNVVDEANLTEKKELIIFHNRKSYFLLLIMDFIPPLKMLEIKKKLEVDLNKMVPYLS